MYSVFVVSILRECMEMTSMGQKVADSESCGIVKTVGFGVICYSQTHSCAYFIPLLK